MAKHEKVKRPVTEEIVSDFNHLRQEQRALVAKVTELEMELNEHSLVADALKEVDSDRKCYRMVGGVLVQRTVKEVLPAITSNKEQLAKLVENLNQQITKKGLEINEYREKHNILIQGEQSSHHEEEKEEEQELPSSTSVLVES